MPEHILAIDAGTTSVRALVIDAAGRVVARAGERYELTYPAPARVEQDADVLWQKTQAAIRTALGAARLTAADIAGIGVAAQRASIIVWERSSGRAVAPLVSWQDMRGAARAQELLAHGFLVLPQTCASKLEAVIDAISDGRARMKRGELVWGNVESFLIARLSGAHVTDASQACVTGYYDYGGGTWIEPLIAYQGLVPLFFPRLVDTAGTAAETRPEIFGAKVPIAAIVADQQSALLGGSEVAPGCGKITLGTSGTLDIATGGEILMTATAFPLVLDRTRGQSRFCIEGMVITAGALLDWLADGMGLAKDVAAVCALAAQAADAGGVALLPALQGLGTPHANPARRGLLNGLSRATTKAHIARAGLEGIAFRLREITEHIYQETPLPRPAAFRIDGGAAESDLLVQMIADVTGIALERPAERQATALGAAILAGQALGVFDVKALAHLRRIDRVFEPLWSQDERMSRYEAWVAAVAR